MKRVLITGGTGFIGSWLVKELIADQVEVTLLTSASAVGRDIPEQVKIVSTTYQDFEQLADIIPKGFDAFYHLGWAGVSGKDKNDIPLQLKNIQSSIEAMELSKKLECRKFIAAGTVAEYVFCKDIIDFSLKQTPNDLYGATKVAVHYLLEAVAKKLEQDMIWVVLPSTFGEGRKGDNIISYTIINLLKGKKPQYGSLDQMWDFLYVSEVARALVLIGEFGTANKTYGVGSGEYRPLKDYIMKIRDMIDPSLPLGIGEVPSLSNITLSSCVNIQELMEDTGFQPGISFEEGMKRTIPYYMEHMSE